MVVKVVLSGAQAPNFEGPAMGAVSSLNGQTRSHALQRISDLFAPIASDLDEAERVFDLELASDSPFVQNLVDHCSLFRGKRLRPALVLLAGHACGGIRPAHPILAAVIEMIHTATLIHDDILDEAVIRRHAATVNSEWGNEAAVLMGDFFFTHAFHLAASLESTLACRWIGHATNLVCEGEMLQVHHRGNLELDEQQYYSMIRGKTAELTAVACRLGAQYAGASESTVEDLDTFGRELGVAFQIADDVLDLWGEEAFTGKSLGTDLVKQKLTLPILRFLSNASSNDAIRARELISQACPSSRSQLIRMLSNSDAREYSWATAQACADRAAQRLASLPESQARSILKRLTEAVVRRGA